jgi:hypothetical protein
MCCLPASSRLLRWAICFFIFAILFHGFLRFLLIENLDPAPLFRRWSRATGGPLSSRVGMRVYIYDMPPKFNYEQLPPPERAKWYADKVISPAHAASAPTPPCR